MPRFKLTPKPIFEKAGEMAEELNALFIFADISDDRKAQQLSEKIQSADGDHHMHHRVFRFPERAHLIQIASFKPLTETDNDARTARRAAVLAGLDDADSVLAWWKESGKEKVRDALAAQSDDEGMLQVVKLSVSSQLLNDYILNPQFWDEITNRCVNAEDKDKLQQLRNEILDNAAYLLSTSEDLHRLGHFYDYALKQLYREKRTYQSHYKAALRKQGQGKPLTPAEKMLVGGFVQAVGEGAEPKQRIGYYKILETRIQEFELQQKQLAKAMLLHLEASHRLDDVNANDVLKYIALKLRELHVEGDLLDQIDELPTRKGLQAIGELHKPKDLREQIVEDRKKANEVRTQADASAQPVSDAEHAKAYDLMPESYIEKLERTLSGKKGKLTTPASYFHHYIQQHLANELDAQFRLAKLADTYYYGWTTLGKGQVHSNSDLPAHPLRDKVPTCVHPSVRAALGEKKISRKKYQFLGGPKKNPWYLRIYLDTTFKTNWDNFNRYAAQLFGLLPTDNRPLTAEHFRNDESGSLVHIAREFDKAYKTVKAHIKSHKTNWFFRLLAKIFLPFGNTNRTYRQLKKVEAEFDHAHENVRAWEKVLVDQAMSELTEFVEKPHFSLRSVTNLKTFVTECAPDTAATHHAEIDSVIASLSQRFYPLFTLSEESDPSGALSTRHSRGLYASLGAQVDARDKPKHLSEELGKLCGQIMRLNARGNPILETQVDILGALRSLLDPASVLPEIIHDQQRQLQALRNEITRLQNTNDIDNPNKDTDIANARTEQEEVLKANAFFQALERRGSADLQRYHAFTYYYHRPFTNPGTDRAFTKLLASAFQISQEQADHVWDTVLGMLHEAKNPRTPNDDFYLHDLFYRNAKRLATHLDQNPTDFKASLSNAHDNLHEQATTCIMGVFNYAPLSPHINHENTAGGLQYTAAEQLAQFLVRKSKQPLVELQDPASAEGSDAGSSVSDTTQRENQTEQELNAITQRYRDALADLKAQATTFVTEQGDYVNNLSHGILIHLLEDPTEDAIQRSLDAAKALRNRYTSETEPVALDKSMQDFFSDMAALLKITLDDNSAAASDNSEELSLSPTVQHTMQRLNQLLYSDAQSFNELFTPDDERFFKYIQQTSLAPAISDVIMTNVQYVLQQQSEKPQDRALGDKAAKALWIAEKLCSAEELEPIRAKRVQEIFDAEGDARHGLVESFIKYYSSLNMAEDADKKAAFDELITRKVQEHGRTNDWCPYIHRLVKAFVDKGICKRSLLEYYQLLWLDDLYEHHAAFKAHQEEYLDREDEAPNHLAARHNRHASNLEFFKLGFLEHSKPYIEDVCTQMVGRITDYLRDPQPEHAEIIQRVVTKFLSHMDEDPVVKGELDNMLQDFDSSLGELRHQFDRFKKFNAAREQILHREFDQLGYARTQRHGQEEHNVKRTYGTIGAIMSSLCELDAGYLSTKQRIEDYYELLDLIYRDAEQVLRALSDPFTNFDGASDKSYPQDRPNTLSRREIKRLMTYRFEVAERIIELNEHDRAAYARKPLYGKMLFMQSRLDDHKLWFNTGSGVNRTRSYNYYDRLLTAQYRLHRAFANPNTQVIKRLIRPLALMDRLNPDNIPQSSDLASYVHTLQDHRERYYTLINHLITAQDMIMGVLKVIQKPTRKTFSENISIFLTHSLMFQWGLEQDQRGGLRLADQSQHFVSLETMNTLIKTIEEHLPEDQFLAKVLTHYKEILEAIYQARVNGTTLDSRLIRQKYKYIARYMHAVRLGEAMRDFRITDGEVKNAYQPVPFYLYERDQNGTAYIMNAAEFTYDRSVRALNTPLGEDENTLDPRLLIQGDIDARLRANGDSLLERLTHGGRLLAGEFICRGSVPNTGGTGVTSVRGFGSDEQIRKFHHITAANREASNLIGHIARGSLSVNQHVEPINWASINEHASHQIQIELLQAIQKHVFDFKPSPKTHGYDNIVNACLAQALAQIEYYLGLTDPRCSDQALTQISQRLFLATSIITQFGTEDQITYFEALYGQYKEKYCKAIDPRNNTTGSSLSSRLQHYREQRQFMVAIENAKRLKKGQKIQWQLEDGDLATKKHLKVVYDSLLQRQALRNHCEAYDLKMHRLAYAFDQITEADLQFAASNASDISYQLHMKALHHAHCQMTEMEFSRFRIHLAEDYVQEANEIHERTFGKPLRAQNADYTDTPEFKALKATLDKNFHRIEAAYSKQTPFKMKASANSFDLSGIFPTVCAFSEESPYSEKTLEALRAAREQLELVFCTGLAVNAASQTKIEKLPSKQKKKEELKDTFYEQNPGVQELIETKYGNSSKTLTKSNYNKKRKNAKKQLAEYTKTGMKQYWQAVSQQKSLKKQAGKDDSKGKKQQALNVQRTISQAIIAEASAQYEEGHVRRTEEEVENIKTLALARLLQSEGPGNGALNTKSLSHMEKSKTLYNTTLNLIAQCKQLPEDLFENESINRLATFAHIELQLFQLAYAGIDESYYKALLEHGKTYPSLLKQMFYAGAGNVDFTDSLVFYRNTTLAQFKAASTDGEIPNILRLTSEAKAAFIDRLRHSSALTGVGERRASLVQHLTSVTDRAPLQAEPTPATAHICHLEELLAAVLECIGTHAETCDVFKAYQPFCQAYNLYLGQYGATYLPNKLKQDAATVHKHVAGTPDEHIAYLDTSKAFKSENSRNTRDKRLTKKQVLQLRRKAHARAQEETRKVEEQMTVTARLICALPQLLEVYINELEKAANRLAEARASNTGIEDANGDFDDAAENFLHLSHLFHQYWSACTQHYGDEDRLPEPVTTAKNNCDYHIAKCLQLQTIEELGHQRKLTAQEVNALKTRKITAHENLTELEQQFAQHAPFMNIASLLEGDQQEYDREVHAGSASTPSELGDTFDAFSVTSGPGHSQPWALPGHVLQTFEAQDTDNPFLTMREVASVAGSVHGSSSRADDDEHSEYSHNRDGETASLGSEAGQTDDDDLESLFGTPAPRPVRKNDESDDECFGASAPPASSTATSNRSPTYTTMSMAMTAATTTTTATTATTTTTTSKTITTTASSLSALGSATHAAQQQQHYYANTGALDSSEDSGTGVAPLKQPSALTLSASLQGVLGIDAQRAADLAGKREEEEDRFGDVPTPDSAFGY